MSVTVDESHNKFVKQHGSYSRDTGCQVQFDVRRADERRASLFSCDVSASSDHTRHFLSVTTPLFLQGSVIAGEENVEANNAATSTSFATHQLSPKVNGSSNVQTSLNNTPNEHCSSSGTSPMAIDRLREQFAAFCTPCNRKSLVSIPLLLSPTQLTAKMFSNLSIPFFF